MKRCLLLGLMLPLVGLGLRVDAANGVCEAPSTPDPESKPIAGCEAPAFWVDDRSPAERGEVSPTLVTPTEVTAAPPAPAADTPPIGSGAGQPMVVDEGMGRQEVAPDANQARMMRAAGLAAGLRGEAVKEEFSSDVNYLRGYAQGQAERLNGVVRP